MCKFLFSLIFSILIVILISCEDYVVKDRDNPYDPENPLAVSVTSLTRLTEKGEYDYPSWSPDETRIAFYDKSVRSIYIMDTSGTSIEKLTYLDDHEWETSPRWSPIEDKIAYIHSPNWDISVRDYPGSHSFQLTKDGKCEPGFLTWSRDGSKIAYVQEGTIKTMDVDGSNQQALEPDVSIEPILMITDWSPDGSKLLMICGEEPRAYTINVRTHHVQLIPTGEDRMCLNAVWSTDGSKLLYVSFNYDRRELWIMNADGEQKVAVLTNDISPYAELIYSINWSKDDSTVLFIGSDQFYGQDSYICMLKMELRSQNR